MSDLPISFATEADEKEALITAILGMACERPEEKARAREAYGRLSLEEIRTTHEGLMTLAAKGREILNRMTPEQRARFITLGSPRKARALVAELDTIAAGMKPQVA